MFLLHNVTSALLFLDFLLLFFLFSLQSCNTNYVFGDTKVDHVEVLVSLCVYTYFNLILGGGGRGAG